MHENCYKWIIESYSLKVILWNGQFLLQGFSSSEGMRTACNISDVFIQSPHAVNRGAVSCLTPLIAVYSAETHAANCFFVFVWYCDVWFLRMSKQMERDTAHQDSLLFNTICSNAQAMLILTVVVL